MRALLILCSTLILSGCFYSDNALIGRRLAQFPLDDGVYAHTPYDENGQPWVRPAWAGEIRRRGWIYSSDVADFPHEGARMREMTPGIYAVMKPSDGYYVYGVMFLYPDGIATYHMPSCADLEDSAIAVYDVERDEDGYCEIPSWTALSSVLQLYLGAIGDEMRIDGIYRRAD